MKTLHHIFLSVRTHIFELRPVTQLENLKSLCRSPGNDGLVTDITKKIISDFSPLLMHICSTFFSTGISQDPLKTANIIPIHMGGASGDAKNIGLYQSPLHP